MRADPDRRPTDVLPEHEADGTIRREALLGRPPAAVWPTSPRWVSAFRARPSPARGCSRCRPSCRPGPGFRSSVSQ